MGRKPQDKDTVKTIERLHKRIENLTKANTRDLQEMAERGKDLVKLANIIRGCEDIIEQSVYEKLIDVVKKFEERCYVTRRKRIKKGNQNENSNNKKIDEDQSL